MTHRYRRQAGSCNDPARRQRAFADWLMRELEMIARVN